MSRKRFSICSLVESQQKRDVFSADQKIDIRGRISHHMGSSLSVDQLGSGESVRFMSRKWIVSGGVIASLLVFLYGVGSFTTHNVIIDNSLFTVLRSPQSISMPRALASSVGQVISADGAYSIMNNGITYTTNMLYDDDFIELAADARLSFRVDDHQAYIIGPALVHVRVDDHGYRFVLVEGNFLEVFSPRHDSGSSLTVEMKDMLVAHHAHDTTMKVSISTDQQGETVIKNYADSILVSNVSDIDDAKEIAPETQLTVSADTSVADAHETTFSIRDIAFVSDVSTAVRDGEDALAPFVAANTGDSSSLQTGDRVDTAAFAVIEGSGRSSGAMTSSIEAATLSLDIPDVASGDIALDRLMPTVNQLDLLRRLTDMDIGNIDMIWGDMVSLYGCDPLPAVENLRIDYVSFCLMSLIDRYHTPPSLGDALIEWLSTIREPSDVVREDTKLSTGVIMAD